MSDLDSPNQFTTFIPERRRTDGGLRQPISLWKRVLLATLSLVLVFTIWWFVTRGETAQDRIVSTIPSPAETFAEFPSLWGERNLPENTYASLKRVVIGFSLATIVGVPLGVMCGCFPGVAAFCSPLLVFGRNAPMAAMIPLTFMLFGIGEFQKSMFIFIAAVAFIVTDSAQAIRNVADRYIDTAYTLGARRWQVVLKVLVPLAMPNIFNSLRLLFGLAFGYIMLVEVVQIGTDAGGLGAIINNSRRRGPPEHIFLVLMLIPILALMIDSALFWVQSQLFPFKYGGDGTLAMLLKQGIYRMASVKELFWQSPVDVACQELLDTYQGPSAATDSDENQSENTS